MSQELSDTTTALVIRAMCCVIAADARVSGSEIDVVFDALAATGHRTTREQFRTQVISACQQIHRKGVMVVVESLCEQLATLKGGPLAEMVLQLQEDVMHSDMRVTDSEKTVVARFRQALSAETVSAGCPITARGSDDPSKTEEPLLCLRYTEREHALSCVLAARRTVDTYVGSRLLVAIACGFATGLTSLVASGVVVNALIFTSLGFLIPIVVLCAGADDTLVQIAEAAPRERAIEAALEDQAVRFIDSLDIPPAVGTDEIAVSDHVHSEADSDQEQEDARGFETAFGLVSREGGGLPYRTKLARRVYGFLRGSRQPGGGRSACRCTECGRKYWFRIGSDGSGVICPYCGRFQRAALDWKQVSPIPSPHPSPNIVQMPHYPGRLGVQTFSGGPVTVRGYVNRRGKWVQSHSRSRPRRRKW